MTQDADAGLVATTSRGLRDYLHMFNLSRHQVGQARIADCAAGASAFGVQARGHGATVISIDPVYTNTAAHIRTRVEHNLAGARSWLTANHNAVNWDYLGEVADYVRHSQQCLDLFLGDFTTAPQHYLAAGLPRLPLRDGAVEIALCANYLFAYPDVVSPSDTVTSILELSRIATQYVMIHPVHDRNGRPLEHLNDIIETLQEHGLRIQTHTASRSWLKNARTMTISLTNQP